MVYCERRNWSVWDWENPYLEAVDGDLEANSTQGYGQRSRYHLKKWPDNTPNWALG